MNAAAGEAPLRVFLERTRELAALASSMKAVRAGQGVVCLVSGEPGIGKSRLLTEFAADCQRQGVGVHWGSAWEAGGAPAYWPWIQILRSLLAQAQARAALEKLPHHMAAIAQLIPELAGADAQRPTGLEPEQARFRLMDSVGGFLQVAAAAAPLVIVIEDAHATDPDSLVLLEFVARQLRASRTLLLASYRDADLHRPRVGNVITRIKREAVQLNLERLGRDSVREYIRSATGERPLEQTVTEIFRLTEGHPLYLQEVVEIGIARGGFRAIPATLSSAIDERVAELPEQTQSLLRVGSVLGREIDLDTLAELAAQPREAVETQLAPALAMRILEQVAPDRLRFEHMLVREALHDSIPVAQRRALHESRARRLQREVDDDGKLPWPELARHFEQSGQDGRHRAIDAWRRAALQADARHAFDDAALCCARALEAANSLGGAAGAGAVGRTESASDLARANTTLRTQLLLELGTAQIRVGDVDAGRRNSTAAFNLAESLGDTGLMADAALAYGGIFTFANVDRRLVQLLRKAFDALGDDESKRKARVLARLAAAMQPAADPSEPIKLAREAIDLARGSQDQRTLLSTLRSAISAMMDLGDPVERLQLNREYVALAERLGDTSERMRGYMRMVIDAMELGDPETMDHAIDQCGALAQELALPHYQWTAAAFRVMQATIRGNLNIAIATLEQAERIAQHAQDPNAARALIVQRTGIAELRGSTEEMTRLVEEMDRSFANLPMAETYLKPYLITMRMRCGEMPAADEIDADLARRIIQFRDLASICSLGEVLAAHRDATLATEVYEALLPHQDLCGHWGLLGMRWVGPVARVLGLLAVVLGKPREAERHFDKALEIAQRMNAKPWVDRIRSEWNGIGKSVPAARSVSRAAAARAAAARGVPTVDYFRLTREGDVWVCECEGRQFRLRDSRGLQMLARLISEPGREIHVLDLAGPVAGDSAVDAGDSGELLDEKARRDYRRRIEELRVEIAEAEETGDAATAESAREELEHLTGELARAFGLAGRARRAGSAVERARVNVQRRLKDAQGRIARECPAAGRHLEWAVRTGIFCSYTPT